MESLSGRLLNAVVVDVAFEGTLNYGECTIRCLEVHGDANQTPDADLPVALYYNQSIPHSFGTIDVGSNVVVSFLRGQLSSPIIEGIALDLDALKDLCPEYESKYGSVKGFISKRAGFVWFVDEDSGEVIARFKDGSTVTQTATGLVVRATNVQVIAHNVTANAEDSVVINADRVQANVQGQLSATANVARINCQSGNITSTGAFAISANPLILP